MLRSRVLRGFLFPTTTKENFRLSTLPSGLRVLTVDDGSCTTGIGLFTKNGCKDEDKDSYGAAAVLENLALKGNALITSEDISHSLGILGNTFKVTNQKEHQGTIIMTPRYHSREALELLNCIVLHPTKDAAVLDEAKALALLRAEQYDRDATRVCFELTHQAGWGSKSVGNSINPTAEQLASLTVDGVHRFHARCTTPTRSVVVATGVTDHDAFCTTVQKTLQFPEAGGSPTSSASALLDGYVGGYSALHNTKPPESVKKFAEKNLSHVCLMVKAVKLSDPDYYTVSLIQTLLGGGTSFSSGGPGKGMQTKLWREVLRREGWLHGIECVSAWYEDGGMIGIYGSCPHEWVANLVLLMAFQLGTIGCRVTQDMVDMAKNQMRSQLILLGEGREQLLTDMGNNLLSHHYIATATDIMQGTERVTVKELERVCERLVQTPLTYAVYGNTKAAGLLDYDRAVASVRAAYAKHAAK
jgi:processing peptidase subunit alpha